MSGRFGKYGENKRKEIMRNSKIKKIKIVQIKKPNIKVKIPGR